MAKRERVAGEKEKAPAFQLYVKEFLSDANQAGMSLQETGAYIRLMCFEWNEHGNGLDDDLIRCGRMVGAPVGAMKKMWPVLRARFVEHATALRRIVHPRLEVERTKQAMFRRRQADNANKRWEASQVHATAVPEASHVHALLSPISHLPSADTKKLKAVRAKQPPDPRVAEFVGWFVAEYAKRRSGAEYLVNDGKDQALVKRMLATTSPERLRLYAQILLSDKTDDDWIINTDRGIGILKSRFNWLSERLASWEAKQKTAAV